MTISEDQAGRPGGKLLAVETIAWLMLAAGMWAYSVQFEADLEAYHFGPVSWPRAALGAIAVLAIVQLLVAKAVAGRTSSGVRDTTPGVAKGETGVVAWWRIVATFAVPLVYLALLPHTGYFITTPLFLAAYMLVFRERSAQYIAITTIGLYVVSLVVFSKLLFVPLPTGNLPGFYDFSNWLLEIINAF